MDSPAQVDLELLLNGDLSSKQLEEACQAVVQSFHHTGVLILKDPRVNESHNQRFLDMMERYYQSASQKLYNGDKVAEIFPEYGYQVGATPENIEKARNHCERINNYPEEHRPQTDCPPQVDAKWRYFWRVGELPENHGVLEKANVVPEEFPEWREVMDQWGELMLNAVKGVVRMFEIGVGLPENYLIDMMQYAPHLLAPTGSDLAKYEPGTIFAGYHYDLNFITIHGKSRFPGLYIWLRNGQKVPVRVPDGCLLLQAGKMFEYLTGGYVLAGFHEVVYSEAAKKVADEARSQNRPLWRVSSTLFSHLRHDVMLRPLPELSSYYPEEVTHLYQPISASDHVMNELKAINLLKVNPE